MRNELLLSLLSGGLVALLTGCPKPIADVKPAANATCDDVAATMNTQLAADLEGQSAEEQTRLTDLHRAMVGASTEACKEDGWSAEAKGCFYQPEDDQGRCYTLLTQPQNEGLQRRIDQSVSAQTPASCDQIPVAVKAGMVAEIANEPAEKQAELTAKVDGFAIEIGVICDRDTWPVEVRTCVRENAKTGGQVGDCMRWLSEAQRGAYNELFQKTFAAP